VASQQPKSDEGASAAPRDDAYARAAQMLPPRYFNEKGDSSSHGPADRVVALARVHYAVGSLHKERKRRRRQAATRAASRESAEAGTGSDPPSNNVSPEDLEAEEWLRDPAGKRPSMYEGGWPKTHPDGSIQYSWSNRGFPNNKALVRGAAHAAVLDVADRYSQLAG
jgi:hypothetical protein